MKERRFCCGCDRTLPRSLFSEKEWELEERWCVSCVAEDTAYRIGVGLLPSEAQYRRNRELW